MVAGLGQDVILIEDSVEFASEAKRSEFAGYLGGASPFFYENANFTAANSGRYAVDTYAGVVTATLPTAPVNGAMVEFVDARKTWGSYNFTVAAGTSDTIEGNSTLLFYTGWPDGPSRVLLVYLSPTLTWYYHPCGGWGS